jgi:Family of unknown function (DUF5317)
VFILYALVIGVIVGTLAGGRPAGLAALTFRWSGVMLAGLLIQVVLFADPVAERVGALGPPIYVTSTVAVLAAVLANRSIRGMPLVAIGAASNLAAIVANGGYMPATRSAMAALGKVDPAIYSNSAVLDDPALGPLTDVFALPPWLPFANVFSIGDVLIGAGVVLTIALAMRSARSSAATQPTEPGPESAPAST